MTGTGEVETRADVSPGALDVSLEHANVEAPVPQVADLLFDHVLVIELPLVDLPPHHIRVDLREQGLQDVL